MNHSIATPQASARRQTNSLAILDPTKPHRFIKPVKRINEGHDVTHFLTSQAYTDIMTFLMQLNVAMCPRKTDSGQVEAWELDTHMSHPEPVERLRALLQRVEEMIAEAPPDPGPRRFGNVSFRTWHNLLEKRAPELLQEFLAPTVLEFRTDPADSDSPLDELSSYFLGAFGSSQRLDYGTGHELSFLAFLGALWKLGGFGKLESPEDGSLERTIVIGVIERYLQVVRKLILTYTLEPAGSHGVWGLDDHSFLPYIFGSSQYSPPISNLEPMPVEGSLPKAPKPGDIVKNSVVEKERAHNMYFSAIGFINDVKTGPFWEHSPILFDISGIRSGWGKINKGMLKMYDAEVLSKFPVVQHFPFGSLFSWDTDPHALAAQPSVHTMSQPSRTISPGGVSAGRPLPQGGTKAPWAAPTAALGASPSINDGPSTFTTTTRRPARAGTSPSGAMAAVSAEGVTKAPWAKDGEVRRV